MSDLKLSDGRDVDIDLYQLSQKEFRDWFYNPQVDDEVADSYLKKVTGIEKPEELAQPDYRLVVTTIFTHATSVLTDPNSLSESSSTTKKGAKNQSD